MFYSQQYNQYVNEGVAFTLGSMQYPANWLNLTTAEEKAAVGLVEVVTVNEPADQRYYWVTEELNGAERSYVNTPKDLGTLKEQCVSQINGTAYSLLFPSDWMVNKAIETEVAMPAAWKLWRQSIRDVAASTVAAVEASPDIDALEATMNNIVWPLDPNTPPPVAEEGVAA